MLTQTTQPSFGFMVAQNLTTLMESWRSDATHAYGSKNHVGFAHFLSHNLSVYACR